MIVDLRYSPADLTSEIHEAIDTVGTELGMEAVYIEGSIDYYGEDTEQRATEERGREAIQFPWEKDSV